MSAEGILDDPALFARSRGAAADAHLPCKLSLAWEYLSIAAEHPTALKSVVFHVRRMAKSELMRYSEHLNHL